MARFSRKVEALLREIQAELGTLTDGGPTALSWLIPSIREVLESEKAFACTYCERGDGMGIEFGTRDRIDPSMVPFVDAWLADKTVGWTSYNPLRPEPAQRNIALSTDEVSEMTGVGSTPIQTEVYARFGLRTDHNLRVLICEGPSLLAWIGVFQGGAILDRQRRLLNRLVAPVRRRLSAERLLRGGPGLRSVLHAALDEIPAPAFVLGDGGAVLEANAAGARWLESDVLSKRRALQDAIRETSRGHGSTFRVTRVVSAGVGPRFLVVCRGLASTDERCRSAAREWELSPREAEVLQLVGEGLTTRAVAAQLGVSGRTVEVHLTALFEKAQVETRAELIVKALRRSL